MTSPYRERILAHSRDPQHRGPLDPCDHEATLHNPLCGDRVTIRLRGSDRIELACFEARGCAIAIASASMLTCEVPNLTRDSALELAHQVITAVNQGGAFDPLPPDLHALVAIHPLHARRRCATLPWEALLAALA